MIILILLIVVVAAGVYFARQRQKRLTVEVPAVVVRTALRQLAPKDNGRFETDVFFRFDANGSSPRGEVHRGREPGGGIPARHGGACAVQPGQAG